MITYTRTNLIYPKELGKGPFYHHIYIIYTEDLLDEICSLNVGTTFNGVYTGITAYADDIILMSPTISGLQTMLDKCVAYGMKHMIKFNSTKTEFVISGNQHHLLHPFVYVDSMRVYPQQSLTHLGFHWLVNSRSNLASFDKSQLDHRLGEMWGVVNALVTSGIRFCHPDTIFTLYTSVVLPKLLYGLELCKLNKTLSRKLDIAARTALKYLFNISKHSLNVLSEIVNVPSMSLLLNYKKLATVSQLMKNGLTRSLLLSPLASIYSNVWLEISLICMRNSLDLYDVVLFPKNLSKNIHNLVYPVTELAEHMKTLFSCWSLAEKRIEFFDIMERHIPENPIDVVLF